MALAVIGSFLFRYAKRIVLHSIVHQHAPLQFLKSLFSYSFYTAFNKLPIEQFIFCIAEVDQLQMERNSNAIAHTSDQSTFDSKSNTIRSDVKKTDDDNNDMENLYWHTHGSLLWQR